MIEQETTQTTRESSNILERIARDILFAYLWVSGPAMSQQQRVQQELSKSHQIELELDSISIVG